ncbi:TPA: MoaD/ThiS family protein [Legionella pneumophila]|uniref:MoaD/ThiS family protein n=1 Tax=Fluoribacter dumoffii TaxID=463 RepID=A0A377IVT7_9GAMM|nr:Uncharacterised protein [Fluoribacter dumoffii]HAT1865059.1 MoaD/ThiS family protein [Legionella pneumophila]HAT4388930.1 MoaD/ThiS family protein [Legionella pneumophila]HEM7045331.1 MoaD/ThiS family protein [Legionella pneumophila]
MMVSVQFPGALSHLSKSYNIDSKKYWDEFIRELLGSNYKHLFSNETPKEYVLLYLNGSKIESLKEIALKNEDSLHILSAISGG